MRILTAILLVALALPAQATFHLWYINEIYSNADGSVQFIELKAAASGQQFIRGHTIRSSSGSTTNSYTFPNDLLGDSAEGSDPDYGYGGGYGGMLVYKSFLIATQGFAALNVVAPDYIVPNGFLFPAGGTINFGEGADTFTHGALPTDNRSMTRDRLLVTPSPLNFTGASGTVPSQSQSATTSYQGLWIRPSESGWGINFTHQGTVLFATWFTYDTDGTGMWLVMSNGTQTGTGRFEGDLHRTTGPGFDSANFTAIGASNYTRVGSLTVNFSDANNASVTYTVNGVTQTKPIERFLFAAPPTCTLGGTAGASPNYTDLWWRNESESGWGVNIVHQGDILFVTWFTYETGGTAAAPAKGMWLVMAQVDRVGNGVYSGILRRTTGSNAFSATTPFNPGALQQVNVGDATFTFTGPDTGTFRYTVNGVTQTKPITRLRVASPATVCR